MDKEKIFFPPNCFPRGKLNRYYHFIFGYIWPFLQEYTPDDNKTFVFKTCGSLMDEFLKEIKNQNVYDIEIVRLFSEVSRGNFTIKNLPWFDDHHNYDRIKPERLTQGIINLFPDLKDIKAKNEILIIKRLPPDSFYDGNEYSNRSGTAKRDIPNLDDLVYELKSKNIPVKTETFERKSLFEQLKLFRSHNFIIGQHGAAFSHMPVAHKHCKIIEIVCPKTTKRGHWSELAHLYDLPFKRIQQKPDALSNLDIKEAVNIIQNFYIPNDPFM